MRVIKRLPLVEFAQRWPAAESPLDYWYRIVLKAEWTSFADVRQSFGSADQVRVGSGNTVTVFDIGGNKFRLIAKLSFEKQKVYVLRVLTHKEYDRDTWKDEL
jgi:mRNA interferase HigB